jgi:hypothetical protein
MLIEVAGRAGMEAAERERIGGTDARGRKGKKVCRDCGRSHVELFEVSESAYEEWVQEIVARWERWCGEILG